MFGKQKSGDRPGAIDVSNLTFLDGAREFARLWSESGGPMNCIINPHALGPDPFLFGMAMVDTVRHGAKAYARAVGLSEDEALARIWEGLDAERSNPTDDPRQVGADGSRLQ